MTLDDFTISDVIARPNSTLRIATHRDLGDVVVKCGDVETEADALQALAECPGIVRVLARGPGWFAMPRVEATTIVQYGWRQRYEIPAVIERIGVTLDAMHELGWHHGDLHIENVLVSADGTPTLIDFAKAWRREGCSRGETPECAADRRMGVLWLLAPHCEARETALRMARP